MTLTPLGKEIKKKLIDKDMTQVELAEQLGVTKQYITKIITGTRTGFPSVKSTECPCGSASTIREQVKRTNRSFWMRS